MFTKGILASLLFMVAAVIYGCEEASFRANQRLNAGSLSAVEACVTRNESELVSAELILRQCVSKHEQPIYLYGEYGTGSFTSWGGGFAANIKNTSDTHILTGLTLEINFLGENPSKESKVFRGLWIEPGNTTSLAIPRGEIEREGDLSLLVSSEDWTWQWAALKGIKVTVN